MSTRFERHIKTVSANKKKAVVGIWNSPFIFYKLDKESLLNLTVKPNILNIRLFFFFFTN